MAFGHLGWLGALRKNFKKEQRIYISMCGGGGLGFYSYCLGFGCPPGVSVCGLVALIARQLNAAGSLHSVAVVRMGTPLAVLLHL